METGTILEPVPKPTSCHVAMPAKQSSTTQGVYETDRLARFHEQLPPQNSGHFVPGLNEILEQTEYLAGSFTQQDFSDSGYGSHPADIVEGGVSQSQDSRLDTTNINYDISFTGSEQSHILEDYLNIGSGL